MPTLLIWGLVFIVSLVVLVKAADWFIDAAESMGLALGITSFLVGLTIVALGTSIPELASSIAAISKGSTEIVVSNVIGSNITNVLLVLGTVIVIGSGNKLNFTLKKGDTFLLVGSAIFLIFACLNDKMFTTWEAAVCAAGILAYVLYHFRNYKKDQKDNPESEERPPFKWINIPILIGSILLIKYSADFNIDSIIKIAEILDIGKEIISVSAVALGTSLPELLVSLNAAKKGNLEIAMGNILGSNILNIFAVMGIPGLLSNLIVPPFIIQHGLYLLAFATIGLFFVLFSGRMNRGIGIIFLLGYLYFLSILILNNMALI